MFKTDLKEVGTMVVNILPDVKRVRCVSMGYDFMQP